MGSNKAHPRGKPQAQRRDKIKPALQQNTQPRSLASNAQQAAANEPAPHAQPRVAPPPMPKPEPEPVASAESPQTDAPSASAHPPHAANGASEALPGRHITQHAATPPSELTPMFEELRQLFAQDRVYGARPDAARCGVCYLTFPRDELTYHEQDGFYTCASCANSLGQHRLPMLRRQRK